MNTGRSQTIAELQHRTARRYPGKRAIACGGVAWTYSEFDALCSRLAAGLHENGIAKGAHVAVLSRNSHAFAALRFALARLGAVLVPINFMLKAEEIAYILRHAGARTLAVDEGLAELGRSAARLDTKVTQFIGLPGETSAEPQGSGLLGFAKLAATTSEAPTVELSGGDVAQIVYTSGTESLPKGAIIGGRGPDARDAGLSPTRHAQHRDARLVEGDEGRVRVHVEPARGLHARRGLRVVANEHDVGQRALHARLG